MDGIPLMYYCEVLAKNNQECKPIKYMIITQIHYGIKVDGVNRSFADLWSPFHVVPAQSED